MTFEQQHELACDMVQAAYPRLGWTHEQSPMIFALTEDGQMEVYLVPFTVQQVGGDRFKDMVNSLHQELAGKNHSAILFMEAWTVSGDDLPDRPSLDPRREEIIMVNIRMKGQQRVGMVKLDREARRLTPGKLIDPHDWTGRFVDGIRQ